jgi:ankyrin repeat protein
MAADLGNEVIVVLLLEASADPKSKDSNDRTPLHYSARHNHALAARLICDAGGDVHAFDISGFTPVDCAFEVGADDFLRISLEFRANPNISFRKG